MKVLYSIMMLVSVFCLAGCGSLEANDTDQALNIPLGSGGLRLGMTKNQVVALYGDPDIKDTVSSPAWGHAREEWFYKAEMGVLPVNAGYLSEDLYLYFDGDNLTNISKKPLGKAKE